MLFTFYRIPEVNYIGVSMNFKRRKVDHNNAIKNVKSVNYNHPLYRKIRALGLDTITFEILDVIDLETRRQTKSIELKYIEQFDSIENGVNGNKPFDGTMQEYYNNYYHKLEYVKQKKQEKYKTIAEERREYAKRHYIEIRDGIYKSDSKTAQRISKMTPNSQRTKVKDAQNARLSN
jgi:hypothetical protein